MRTLLIAIVGLVVAGPVQAEIVPLVQERFLSSVTYSEFAPSSETKTSAPDFGYFESGVGFGTSHISDILPLELRGELNAQGAAGGGGPEGDTWTNSLSFYRVEFDIDESTEYALTADLLDLDGSGWGLGEAELTLSIYNVGLGDYEPLLHYLASVIYGSQHHVVSETGTLAPGRYQLEVSARGHGMVHSQMGGISGSGHATFSLTVPTDPQLPTLSPWSQLALIVGLLATGLGVWRWRAPPNGRT